MELAKKEGRKKRRLGIGIIETKDPIEIQALLKKIIPNSLKLLVIFSVIQQIVLKRQTTFVMYVDNNYRITSKQVKLSANLYMW